MNKYETNLRDEGIGGARKTAGFPYQTHNDFAVSYTPIRAGIFSIYLFGEIEDASQFIPAIEVLQAAGENDVVIVHLSTDGGSLDATDTFIAAMRECEARIIVKATGGVHSAGTVILLNADEFTLSENFNSLIHNGGCGPAGKYSDWKSAAQHTERYMEGTMRRTYAGFLSDEEIQAVIDGRDIWLDADEFAARWEARNDIIRARMEEGQGNALSALLGASKAAQKPPRKPRKKKAAPEAVEAA